MKTNDSYVMGVDAASKSRDHSCIVVLRRGDGAQDAQVVAVYRRRVGVRKLAIMLYVLSRLYRVDSSQIFL